MPWINQQRCTPLQVSSKKYGTSRELSCRDKQWLQMWSHTHVVSGASMHSSKENNERPEAAPRSRRPWTDGPGTHCIRVRRMEERSATRCNSQRTHQQTCIPQITCQHQYLFLRVTGLWKVKEKQMDDCLMRLRLQKAFVAGLQMNWLIKHFCCVDEILCDHHLIFTESKRSDSGKVMPLWCTFMYPLDYQR